MANMKVAIGHNNTGGLADISTQPRWTPGTFAGVKPSLSGQLALLGKHLVLEYEPGLDDPLWNAVFTQCGLSIASDIYFSDNTVQVPYTDASTINYNCTFRYIGDGTRKQGGYWNSRILVVAMVEI